MLIKSIKKQQVVIAGAGLIGSTMALALASQGFDVTVFDGATEEDRIKRNKGRTYALSRASKNLLLILVFGMKKIKRKSHRKHNAFNKKRCHDPIRHLAEFKKEISEFEPSSYMIEDCYLRKVLSSELNKNRKFK